VGLSPVAKWAALPCLIALLSALLIAPARGQEKSKSSSDQAAKLVGRWEIFKTKAPGEPYKQGYKKRPFVSSGPNAFTLVMDYRQDGTFRRVSRIGPAETVHEGQWNLSGHELRQRSTGARDEEVIYVRFDGGGELTLVEVFEGSQDPGLFASFKRVP
jgi:hypothetical protein